MFHDFAVVAQAAGMMAERGNDFRAILHLAPPGAAHERSGLAVWVGEGGKVEAIQAAGGME